MVLFTKQVLNQSSIEGLVEKMGLEPTTLCLQSSCAPNCATSPWWTSRDSNSIPYVANVLCYL